MEFLEKINDFLRNFTNSNEIVAIILTIVVVVALFILLIVGLYWLVRGIIALIKLCCGVYHRRKVRQAANYSAPNFSDSVAVKRVNYDDKIVTHESEAEALELLNQEAAEEMERRRQEELQRLADESAAKDEGETKEKKPAPVPVAVEGEDPEAARIAAEEKARKKERREELKRIRTGYYGKWEVFRDESRGYRYRLVASNGERLCTSEIYGNKGSIRRGTDAFTNSVQNDHFEIYQDKNDMFQIKFYNDQGRIIVVGETYTSEQGARNAVESMKRFSLTAKFIDYDKEQLRLEAEAQRKAERRRKAAERRAAKKAEEEAAAAAEKPEETVEVKPVEVPAEPEEKKLTGELEFVVTEVSEDFEKGIVDGAEVTAETEAPAEEKAEAPVDGAPSDKKDET